MTYSAKIFLLQNTDQTWTESKLILYINKRSREKYYDCQKVMLGNKYNFE